MFTIEEFKKIFELKILSDEWVLYPESDGGIHYLPKEEENSVYAIYIKNGVMTRGIATYRLFLQEVIEGINRNNYKSVKVVQTDTEIVIRSYLTNEVLKICPIKFFKGDMVYQCDQAKEQAIRYVLEKMEG